jgi:hypothetical protein
MMKTANRAAVMLARSEKEHGGGESGQKARGL